MCLSARDRRRGRRGDVPVCVCVCVSSCSWFREWAFTCHRVPLACRRSSQLREVCCVRVCYGYIRSLAWPRADGLLVPISGYRVPSLKLIAHPPLPTSGSANQLACQTLFTPVLTGWTPSLTPPLTLHGFASHHHPKTIAYYYRQASARIGHRPSASRPTTALCL